MAESTHISEVIFGLRLRTYQEDLLQKFEELRSNGESVFHFLAPPGSGKTIMGLEMLRRLGQKAVIFSPNSAIQGQWMEKLRGLTDEISTSQSIDDDPDFISLTYQSISVKEAGSSDLHPNSLRLIDKLSDRRVIVLDECHHMTSFWAEVIKKLITEDSIVIGLTATPPIHREAAALNTYLEILGDIDFQIAQPAIIKEGFLAPFQDLVYLTEAGQDEVAGIEAQSREFGQLLTNLEERDPKKGTAALQWFAYAMLEEFRDSRGKIVAFDEALIAYPDLCISLVRYVRSKIGDLPASVILIDEMEEDVSSADLVNVLGAYCAALQASDEEEDGTYLAEIRNFLKKLGYSFNGRQFYVSGSGAIALSQSSSKLDGLIDILHKEMVSMGDDLRCLVLTDFEGDHATAGSSAVQVLHRLTSDEQTDELDPILLTGKTILVDDDLLELFLELAQSFCREIGVETSFETRAIAGYSEVRGTGSGWTTRVYVQFITRLLEDGVTKCIVGTRGLLGEGWDSIRLNTLIDLTYVSTFVSVNQIRGRTLRHNEEDTFKVANNWDVITLADNARQGFQDLDRFYKKHRQFHGISEDGVIEKGVGHVHPSFTNQSPAQVWLRRREINEFMLSRSADRVEVHHKWGVGQPYRNVETVSIDFIPKDFTGRQISAARGVEMGRVFRRNRRMTGLFVLVSPLLAYITLQSIIIHMNLPPLVIRLTVGAVAVLFALSFSSLQILIGRRIRHFTEKDSMEDGLKAFAGVLFDSLQEAGILTKDKHRSQIVIHQRGQDGFRVYLEGDDENVFSLAFAELMDPIQNQRYIIEQTRLDPPRKLFGWLKKQVPYAHEAWFPVPGVLGAGRKTADIFHKHWQQHISPGRLLYAKRGEGKEILSQIFRRKGMPISKRRKEIWL